MSVDKEKIKKKIYEKLPELLPELFKTVVVHIVMIIYHVSMPPWIIVMKVKKNLKSYKNTNGSEMEEIKNNRRMSRRRMRRLNRKADRG